MKKVFQCDFCSYVDAIYERMAEHETSCTYRVNNKHCDSCKHYDVDVFQGVEQGKICRAGDKNIDVYDVYDSNGGCKSHKPESKLSNDYR